MIVFGDKRTFAFTVRGLAGAPEESDPSAAATWAELQLWVDGENLTRHAVTSMQRVEDGLSWPAVYVARWLVGGWDRIFHQHRWALPGFRNVREVCVELNRRVADAIDTDDEEMEAKLIDERDEFVASHSLVAASAGGLVPDVYFGRDGARMSVSVGPSRTHPSTWFLHEALERDVPAALFFDAVRGLVKWVRDQLDGLEAPVAKRDRSAFERWLAQADSPEAAESSLAGYAGLPRATLRSLFEQSFDFELPSDWRLKGAAFDPSTSSVAVVFRALSPWMSVDDVRKLLEHLRGVPARTEAAKLLREYGARITVSSERTDYQQGYDAAVAVREIIGNVDRRLDIESMLATWGLAVCEIAISDSHIDGGVTWDDAHGPMLFVNSNSERAGTKWGRRMVLAHELCHLLLDRRSAHPLRIVSGEWTSPVIERRANAFAAELLLPKAGVLRMCPTMYRLPPDSEQHALMNEFGVGSTTLLEHLQNRFRLRRSYD